MGSVGRAARGVGPKDRNKAATEDDEKLERKEAKKPLSDMAADSLRFILAFSAFCTAAAIATSLPNANANEDWDDPSRSDDSGWGDNSGERWNDGKRASASSLRIMKRFPGENMRIMKRFPGENMRIMKRFPGEDMRIMKRYPGGEDMRIMRRMSPEFDRLRIMKRFPADDLRIMKKRDVSSALEDEEDNNLLGAMKKQQASSSGDKGYYFSRPQGRSRSWISSSDLRIL